MQREKKKVKRFSKFMNNKMDYILFITVLILLSLGVVMVLSASAPSALSSGMKVCPGVPLPSVNILQFGQSGNPF